MACNCNKSKSGGMDDASVNYLLSLIKQEPNERGELSLLDTGDQLIQTLVNIILEKAQYLDPTGLEYLISRLQMMFIIKRDGMDLSHNDFTDALKEKLDGLPTVTELNTKLEALSGPGVKWTIVTQLPDSGEDKTIYLVPLTNGAEPNVYAEYIWVDNKYEMLGSSVQVDLSGYMPTTGGTFTGDVRFQTGGGNYGSTLRFGDGDYTYFKEDTDDHLEIYARAGINIAFTNAGQFTINGTALDTYIQNNAGGTKQITMNGSTYSPNATTGNIALGGVCVKITMNGSTYSVGTTGTIALGTVGANAIHTGTTTPASSLGSNGDFYYKLK